MIFCALLTTLWSLSLSASVPHRDAVGQDALDGRVVQGHQRLLTDVIFAEHSMEVLTLLDDS